MGLPPKRGLKGELGGRSKRRIVCEKILGAKGGPGFKDFSPSYIRGARGKGGNRGMGPQGWATPGRGWSKGGMALLRTGGESPPPE